MLSWDEFHQEEKPAPVAQPRTERQSEPKAEPAPVAAVAKPAAQQAPRQLGCLARWRRPADGIHLRLAQVLGQGCTGGCSAAIERAVEREPGEKDPERCESRRNAASVNREYQSATQDKTHCYGDYKLLAPIVHGTCRPCVPRSRNRRRLPRDTLATRKQA